MCKTSNDFHRVKQNSGAQSLNKAKVTVDACNKLGGGSVLGDVHILTVLMEMEFA